MSRFYRVGVTRPWLYHVPLGSHGGGIPDGAGSGACHVGAIGAASFYLF